MRIFALHNLGPAGSYARYADQEPQLCEAWCREPGGILPPRNNVSQVRHAVANNGREHFALDQGRVRRAELAEPDAQGVRLFRRFLD